MQHKMTDNQSFNSVVSYLQIISGSIGETFRVLKEKEIRQFGEYRTRRLVLEVWDRLEGVEPAPAYVPTAAPDRPAEPEA
jgi:hypothetical protein